MKKLVISILFLFSSFAALAQTTAVTATITDSDSTIWINPQWSVQFVPNPNFPNLSSYSIAGVPITSNTYSQYIQVNGTGNSSGVISTTLLDNGQVLPAGSMYRFVVQSQTSAPATTYAPFKVTGASQSLTSFLSTNSIVPRFPSTQQAFGYADVEISVTPQPGGYYYNVVNSVQRVWSGSAWANSGGSGGTPCTGVVNGIQYNNAGAFGCNAALIFNPGTGVLTASGFATGTVSQGVLSLTQNAIAAPAAAANTFRLLAPQSGLTSSYDVLVPLLAPTANNAVMAVPSGGGQSTWSNIGEVLIASQVLGGTSGLITFSSIPQNFSHLKIKLVSFCTSSNSFNTLLMDFNASVTGYYTSYLYNNVTTPTAVQIANAASGTIGWAGQTGLVASTEINIYGYSSAITQSATGISSGPSGVMTSEFQVGLGAAITSITMAPLNGSFTTGTIASLYGEL